MKYIKIFSKTFLTGSKGEPDSLYNVRTESKEKENDGD